MKDTKEKLNKWRETMFINKRLHIIKVSIYAYWSTNPINISVDLFLLEFSRLKFIFKYKEPKISLEKSSVLGLLLPVFKVNIKL